MGANLLIAVRLSPTERLLLAAYWRPAAAPSHRPATSGVLPLADYRPKQDANTCAYMFPTDPHFTHVKLGLSPSRQPNVKQLNHVASDDATNRKRSIVGGRLAACCWVPAFGRLVLGAYHWVTYCWRPLAGRVLAASRPPTSDNRGLTAYH